VSAQAIIERCASAGLKLWIGENGGLRFSGDGETLDLLRAELSANKAEILKALAVNSGAPAVETWLADKLATSVQPAIELHRAGELMGFSASQLEAARVKIGGRISSMTGNVFCGLALRQC